MGQPRSFLKTTAVVSSVTLVILYILFQAGGALLPSSKSGRALHFHQESDQPIPADASMNTQPPATEPSKMMLMSGSKSAHHVFGGGNVLYSDSPVEFTNNPFDAASTEPTTHAVVNPYRQP